MLFQDQWLAAGDIRWRSLQRLLLRALRSLEYIIVIVSIFALSGLFLMLLELLAG